MQSSIVHMGGLGRGALGMLSALAYAGAASAAANDRSSEEAPKAAPAVPEFAVRAGAEWGILSAPIATEGRYVRPDGSANVNFYDAGTTRHLIAGRLEVAVPTRLPHGFGLLTRFGAVLGASPGEQHTVVVAGLPLTYVNQPMFFALAAGVELQFIERLFGLGLDFGWAGAWEAGGRVTPAELELTRSESSGPYVRFSALARLPRGKPCGIGLFAAFDAYAQVEGFNSRTSVGAFFEWDGSR